MDQVTRKSFRTLTPGTFYAVFFVYVSSFLIFEISMLSEGDFKSLHVFFISEMFFRHITSYIYCGTWYVFGHCCVLFIYLVVFGDKIMFATLKNYV